MRLLHRHPLLVRAARAAARLGERVVHGGPGRERLLRRLLGAHYGSLLRREWRLADEQPHFFDHRLDAFRLLDGRGGAPPMTRGFLAAEALRPGDVVLDIGCGDGFFDRAFFADRAAAVDAVDVEPTAIEHARRVNAAPNVAYHLLDAVAQPFPRDRYDAVVWDGALAHFPPETTAAMLLKIAAVLAPDGLFAGSETLGPPDHDHLQAFETTDDLAATLSGTFAEVRVREVRYRLADGHERREGFWRCSATDARLRELAWRSG